MSPNSLTHITVGQNVPLTQALQGRKALVVTDSLIKDQFAERFNTIPFVLIPKGEEAKTLHVVETLYEAFLEKDLDRTSVIIGLGGGSITDTAGFAAATYLRGIDFIASPTTLLGQADAAIGGKSGVNFKGFKNLIGSIREPKSIICDVSYLKTLSDESIANGAAELIKHGAILDKTFLESLQSSSKKIFTKDLNVLEEVVKRSIELKLSVVSKDKEEKNLRRLLNFGHTLGHALEASQKISHGEAISIGMIFASEISVRKNLLKEGERDLLIEILSLFKLPTKLYGDKEKLFSAILHDKKREGDEVHMALLEGLGKGIVMPISLSFIEETISDLCKYR